MGKYRLITRSDMDGLVSAVLLKDLNMIGDIKFVHPKDMQDGKIKVTSNDISTNLPYVEGIYLAFDHHISELKRIIEKKDNYIIFPEAPSAAHVVYKYFGGVRKFPNIPFELMEAVDKADSANFKEIDIIDPIGWDLLSFIMDSRTGLGRFKEFRISNKDLMYKLIDYCSTHSIDEILELPDVKERIELLKQSNENSKKQIKRCATVKNNIVILDLRNEDIIYPGNRFLIYTIFPEINISITLSKGKDEGITSFSVGKSIFNKTSKVNIGEILLGYDGGGHQAAGGCQIPNTRVYRVLKELKEKMKEKNKK